MTLKVGDLYKAKNSAFDQILSESNVTPSTIIAYDEDRNYSDLDVYHQIMLLIDDQFYVCDFMFIAPEYNTFKNYKEAYEFAQRKEKMTPMIKVFVNNKVKFLFYEDIELVK